MILIINPFSLQINFNNEYQTRLTLLRAVKCAATAISALQK